MSGAISLSQKKRLLLYLDRFSKFENSWEVPYGVSQEGIGEALDILVNNVSRTLSAMKDEGLVSSRLAHVQGILRRRRVYFLTERGREEAQSIDTDLDSRTFIFRNPGETLEELPLSKLREYLTKDVKRTISVYDVTDYLRTKDIIEIDDFSCFLREKIKEPEPSDTPSTEKTHQIMSMPSVTNFVGREKELNELRNWIGSPSKPIIVIQGIAGIGKSALSAKIADESKEMNLFWFRFHEWSSLRNLVEDLAVFFTSCHRRTISMKLKGNKTMDIADIGNLFLEGISGLSVLIFLDDAQKANSQILSFLNYIVERWDNPRSVGMVVISREMGKFYDTKDVMVRKTVREIVIEGLDEKHSKELLGSVTGEEFSEIYGATKGHPLFLELLRSSAKMEMTRDINTFLEHEILAGLDLNEKEVLEKLSVYQYPVPIPQVLGEGNDYSLVTSLSQKGLIRETQNNLVESHELIKDFIYHRLPKERLHTLHKNAASYYRELSRKENEGEIEGLLHLIKSGDWSKALEWAMEIAETLEEMDLPSIMQLFSEFNEDLLSKNGLANLLFLKGEALSYHEEWNKALGNYTRCLEIGHQAQMEPEVLAKVHNRIGEMQRIIRRWEDTIKSHTEALKLFDKAGDKKGLAREHLSLGIVFKDMKDFRSAREQYEKAKGILTEISDKGGLAAVYNNLGMVYMDMGRLAKARECFDLGLRMAEDEGDLQSKAITIQNLGDLSLSKMDYEGAVGYFRQSRDILSSQNRIKEAQEMALRIGDVYLEIDEPQLALSALAKGLVIGRDSQIGSQRRKGLFRSKENAQMRRPSKITARLHGKMASVYREQQMFKECHEHRNLALDILNKLQNPNDIALEHLEEAYDFEDLKKYDSAIKSLVRGLDLLKGVNNRPAIVAFNLNLARIYSKKRDLENAKRSSEAALRTAEDIGDWLGAKMACEMLVEFYKTDEEGKKRYFQKLREIEKKI